MGSSGPCGRTWTTCTLLIYCRTTIGRYRSGLHHALLPVGLELKKEETRILRINAGTDEPVTHEGEELEEVESFTYLGGVVDKHADVTTWIDKTRSALQCAEKGLEL